MVNAFESGVCMCVCIFCNTQEPTLGGPNSPGAVLDTVKSYMAYHTTAGGGWESINKVGLFGSFGLDFRASFVYLNQSMSTYMVSLLWSS